MREIGTIAYYELRRLVRHRPVMAMTFVLPLLIIFILGSALSSLFVGNRIEAGTIRLALAAEDQGAVADSLRRAADSGQLDFKVVSARSREEALLALDNGRADAGLYLPSDFSAQLQAGGKPEWEYLDGSDLLKNVAGLQRLYPFFDAWSQRYAQAGSWKTGVVPPEPDFGQGAAAGSGDVNLTGRILGGDSFSAVQYYSAHMLMMFMLYLGMAFANGLVLAKLDHSVARLRSMPLPGWKLLLGKMTGYVPLLFAQVAFIVGGSALFLGVDWGRSPLWLGLILVLVMLFTLSLSAAVGIICRSNRTVMLFYQSVVMSMTFLSGGFTPSIGERLSRFGGFTLNYWGAEGLLQMMTGTKNPGELHQAVLILSLWALCALLLAVLLFRKEGYHE